MLPEKLASIYWQEVGKSTGVSLSDIQLTSADDLKNVCDFVAGHVNSDLFEEFEITKNMDERSLLNIEDLAAVKFRGQVEQDPNKKERFPLFGFDLTQYDLA